MSKGKTALRVYVSEKADKSIDHLLIHLTDLQNTILPEATESFFRRNVRLTGELKPGQKVDVRLIDKEAAKNRGYVIKLNILEVHRMTQGDYDMLEFILHESSNSHFQSCQVVKNAYEGRLKELQEKLTKLEQERDYRVKQVSQPLTLYGLLQAYASTHHVEPKGKQGKK
jgi:hypothetical protein